MLYFPKLSKFPRNGKRKNCKQEIHSLRRAWNGDNVCLRLGERGKRYKNSQNSLPVWAFACLNRLSPSLKVCRLLSVLNLFRLRSVPDRPHRTSKKQKKVKHCFFAFTMKSKYLFFFCFLLAAFEAGGNRPQPQGLRASKSRKALMLGVKPGGVPSGFKRSKRFL